MHLEVNGEPRSVDDLATVADLLASLGIGDRPVAVERNREIVTRSTFASTRLADGDLIEIVHFVGGG